MRLIVTALFLLATISIYNNANAQCVVTANSNNYSVHMTVYPIALSNVIATGGDCTFTTEMYYDLEIVGSNAPSSMYTFQGRVHCAGQNRTFDLPNQGGTGVVTSANGGAPYINGDCSAYNETFCDETVIIIQGPQIPYQEVICGYSNPLPVELVDFKGVQENDVVQLSFITASEMNNDFFTIEKTTDGIDWEVLEIVKGKGTTDQVSSYNVVDRNQESNKIYYRLSQTDFDGTHNTYKIIAVNFNSLSDAQYSMYPNPTIDQELNVIFESSSDVPVVCKVYDMLGKEVGSYDFYHSNQLEKIELPEANTTYIVEMTQGNNVIARERIIAR